MKYLMSINYKFFNKEPIEFYNLIYDKIDGVEIYLRNEHEYEYAIQLAQIFGEKLIINIHGNIEDTLVNQMNLIKLAEKISKIQNRKINIVLHSKTDMNKINSISRTIENIKKLEYNKDMITLSLENLNSIGLIKRLNKNDIVPILESITDLKFTYDLGHELIEKGKIIDTKRILHERINNVHFHTYSGISDHHLIYNINHEIKTCIDYLKSIDYDSYFVFEYDFYRCKGNSYEEKIDDFLYSINIIRREFNNV